MDYSGFKIGRVRRSDVLDTKERIKFSGDTERNERRLTVVERWIE